MNSWRFQSLPAYAFPRLRALLNGVEPGAPVIDLSIGQPAHAFPDFITEILHAHRHEYALYPPIDGTPELRRAAAGWLARRFALPTDYIDPDRHIVPVNGTREGLFMAALALTPAPGANQETQAVLIPNPFYQCYAAAALAVNAQPIYVAATKATGFLPDYSALAPEILARTSLVYMCSPANPQGAVADRAYWTRLLDLAQSYDFQIIADECYAEIYDRKAPTGILQAAAEDPSRLDRLMAFHSLSKRSNVPGLRSGFAVGDAGNISRFKRLRSYGGASTPLPVCAAAAAAWDDDEHVAASRALYREKFEAAATIFGTRLGFFRPPGGFYLWLDVSQTGLTGEAAARALWRQGGVKVLPGAYLSRESGGVNPGAHYLRLALVHDLATTREALTRVNRILSTKVNAR